MARKKVKKSEKYNVIVAVRGLVGLNTWIAAKRQYMQTFNKTGVDFYNKVYKMFEHMAVSRLAIWVTRDGLNTFKDHIQYQ